MKIIIECSAEKTHLMDALLKEANLTPSSVLLEDITIFDEFAEVDEYSVELATLRIKIGKLEKENKRLRVVLQKI